MNSKITDQRLVPEQLPDGGPALSPQQVADYLGVSLRQVALMEEAGALPFFSISNRLRRTTKPIVDQLLRACLVRELEDGAE